MAGDLVPVPRGWSAHAWQSVVRWISGWKAGRIGGLAVVGCAGVMTLGVPAGSAASLVRGSGAGDLGVSTVTSGALFGVAAVSAGDAWAVGESGTSALRTLIERWDGTAWTRVPSPSPGPGNDTLSAVAAASATSAWAVGGAGGQPLILHWNGSVWAQQASPVLTSGGTLAAVTAGSATDAWAAGFGGVRDDLIVIEHWDGSRWALVSSPVKVGELVGMAGDSASDVWAVGLSGDPAGTIAALTLHWNGSAWKRVPSPNPPNSGELLGVATVSDTDAWAVSGAAGRAIGTNKTVIDRWNGGTWTRVPSPNPVPGGAILFGVAATSGSDAWAVGVDTDFVVSFENVIEHWNGTSWTLAHSAVRDGSLYAVTATSTSNAWAVGSDGTGRPLIQRWNGTRWARAR